MKTTEFVTRGTPTDKSYLSVQDFDGLYGEKGAVVRREISEIDFEGMTFESFSYLVMTIASPASLNRLMHAMLNAGYLDKLDKRSRYMHDMMYSMGYSALSNVPLGLLLKLANAAYDKQAAALQAEAETAVKQ